MSESWSNKILSSLYLLTTRSREDVYLVFTCLDVVGNAFGIHGCNRINCEQHHCNSPAATTDSQMNLFRITEKFTIVKSPMGYTVIFARVSGVNELQVC